MNSINSLILEGTVSDTKLNEDTLNFSVNVSRFYRNSLGENCEEVSTFDVVFPYREYNKTLVGRITKGRKVRIVGRLHMCKKCDTQGKKQSKIDVLAEHIELKPTVA